MRSHLKQDRLFELAERRGLPVVLSPRVAATGARRPTWTRGERG
jgi:hypothetical protein